MTDEKDPVYFNYYGQLQHQQNMLEDHIRTSAYFKAITQNKKAFEGKVVLDIGAGSGILSFFAAQSGAKRVYAVEASNMAQNADVLVRSNGLEDVIKVIKGKIEEIQLPEQVDVIISEPMGVMLFHERMIESYLYARDNFMKTEAKGLNESFYPSVGNLNIAPFTDGAMYADMRSRCKFWEEENFYGVDLSSMKAIALDQIFAQPVVGGFDPNTLMSKDVEKRISFVSDDVKELYEIRIPFQFEMKYTGVVHGLAGWFSVGFLGPECVEWLQTGPTQDRTHWQQCRFFFRKPVGVNAGEFLSGEYKMSVNDQRSYNVCIEAQIGNIKVLERFNLQDQQYFNLSPCQYPEVAPEYNNLF